jgi:hypothetical protein
VRGALVVGEPIAAKPGLGHRLALRGDVGIGVGDEAAGEVEHRSHRNLAPLGQCREVGAEAHPLFDGERPARKAKQPRAQRWFIGHAVVAEAAVVGDDPVGAAANVGKHHLVGAPRDHAATAGDARALAGPDAEGEAPGRAPAHLSGGEEPPLREREPRRVPGVTQPPDVDQRIAGVLDEGPEGGADGVLVGPAKAKGPRW